MGPSGRAYVPSYAALDVAGATAAAGAALPAPLRAAAASAPAALVNSPALPGLGDGGVEFSVSAPGATFRPVSVVLTQAPDPELDPEGAAAGPGAEARVSLACFAPGGARLAGGGARLGAGAPGRVAFAKACAGAARVTITPGKSSTLLAVDDFVIVPGG
jgi:hypothetical protein